MSEWISCAERLPPIGEWVAVLAPRSGYDHPIVYRLEPPDSFRGAHYRDDMDDPIADAQDNYVTHWMPFPPFPPSPPTKDEALREAVLRIQNLQIACECVGQGAERGASQDCIDFLPRLRAALGET